MKKSVFKSNPKQKLSDPSTWVDQHADAMYRYAILQVRDPRIAEELVQETFLSALQAQNSFQGRASERSWLIGILKHKIIDHIRKSSRERSVEDIEALTNEADKLFDESGRWKPELAPSDWNLDAKSLLEQKEFWEVLKSCLSALSGRAADAFTLREIEELKSEEVCKVLNITPTNLWVLLHRARLQLRRCLEVKWFNKQEGR